MLQKMKTHGSIILSQREVFASMHTRDACGMITTCTHVEFAIKQFSYTLVNRYLQLYKQDYKNLFYDQLVPKTYDQNSYSLKSQVFRMPFRQFFSKCRDTESVHKYYDQLLVLVLKKLTYNIIICAFSSSSP